MKYAEYAIGGLFNRKNIQDVTQFKLNGERSECYRSIFLFGEDYKYFVEKGGKVTGFAGEHIADALVWDFDAENDLEGIKGRVADFVENLKWNYEIPYEYIHVSFSGSKGFHIAIPFQAICENPKPSSNFWKVYKSMAMDLGGDFPYDKTIYELKRIFRLSNTINAKTGLYKIPLNIDDLKFPIDIIKELAKKPRQIELMPVSEISELSVLKDIYDKFVQQNQKPVKEIKNEQYEQTKRNELLDIIKNGCSEGNRHSAAIRITGMLKQKGLDYDFIIEFLRNWNQLNTPPLDNDRLEKESKTAYGDEKPKEEMKIWDIQSGLQKYFDYVKLDSFNQVKIGIEVIDNAMRGISRGETCCIIGKTSVGKSVILQNIGHQWAKYSGQPVLFFSMEMPVTSVVERAIQIECEMTGFETEKLFREDIDSAKQKAKLVYTQIPSLYIIEKSGLDIQKISDFIRFGEDKVYGKKTGLVLIDYLGLVKEKGKDLYEQISRVARGIKDMAKELNVPVVYLSQTTKAYKEYDELTLGSARDSGAIDEASDFVLAIWKRKDDSKSYENNIPLWMGILKNRKGKTIKHKIMFDKRSLRSKDEEDEQFDTII